LLEKQIISAGSSTLKCCMIGWKWTPIIFRSRIAWRASSIARYPLAGSTAPQAWTMRAWRSRIPAVYRSSRAA
jgi:hypothetical protein